ncbi:MAG: SurA N-terminal domain-containing protein [Burkholderiaceae bacterium]|jgi:peptidyl-prolyl cis-trans isomerase D|nr:SurA N-terminal domain-containing protein [Burkholderiaceae bacterium]
MFNIVRDHPRIMMFVLFLLLFPSFVVFGVNHSYFDTNPGAVKVARVQGRGPITQADWDHAVRQASDNIRNSNPGVDIRLFDTPSFKYAALQELVRQGVLTAAAAHERLTISDAQLAPALKQILLSAGLGKPDGSIDMDRYQQFTATQRLSPAGFEAMVRGQLSLQQVMAGVTDTDWPNQALADVAARAQQERRQVRIALFKPGDYSAKLNPAAADLEAFYTAHVAQYQAPESAKIQYVVLDADSIKPSITVNEADLRTYYEQNAAALTIPEQRRASHILITAPKDAPAADRAKAKARAEQLLSQLRQNPDSFAEVAKKNSQDTTTTAQGGDLGWFEQDKGMDPTIAKATFALAKAGDLSAVVESQYGYHIVRLTGIKPARVPPFEQVRARLEDQYRTQQAASKFDELADTFTNTVYEQSDSLQPAADPLKLPIQTAEVTRPSAPGVQGALANPKFLDAIFGADAREKKRNTQAIEIGPGQLIAGRVLAYSPAHAKLFAEVKDQVLAAYLAERGAQLARQAGQQQLKAWQAKPASASGLAAPVALSRQDAGQQPAALVEAVLRADPAKLPALIGVDLGAGGYAIAQVQKVLPWVAPDKTQSAQDLARYDEQWSAAESVTYYDYLKDRYKAQILIPAPAQRREDAPPIGQ